MLDVGPADAAGDDGRTFYLWPEHEPVVRLWLDVQTQWRVGFNGPTGLDYQGVEALMRLRGIKRQQAVELFSGLQIMELAALREFADQRRQRGK